MVFMMAKKINYSFKKGSWKFAKNLFYVIVAGLAAVYGQNQFYLAIAPILAFIENYVKNK